MAIARGIAVAAVLAGFALGAAGAASADTPTMSGSYTLTSTNPDGKKMNTDWSVSSCGNACIYIKAGAGGGQARLVDGLWSMDTMNDLQCLDGTYQTFVTSAHMTWDPNSLAGTNEISYMIPACGHPAGYHQTNQISIKQAS